MADNIIKLKVDSDEYQSKIKRASQGLQALGRSLHDAGKNFADADEKQVEFAKELGKMQTVSNTARGKISELSAAFVNLKSDYLNMTEAEKQSPIGQAMAKSLDELKNRTIAAKQELEDLNKELTGMKTPQIGGGGGSLFSGDKLSGMLQVFGGNLMTKAAGFATGFVDEIGDAVKQGIELAKAGEGIRIAFERLNRPGILSNLREATHGAVTDLELMKAAVKFNDFKLPLEELGTMLAFAQQKAKDTGQSVDYMVDSIVTGLGRKSLMILDNLGLSAAEIKEKMAETGDMTKAVGEIIREQMSQAGDYIETAADRATKADVDLKNAMEELGRTFQPLSDAGTSMFKNLEIGALNLLNNAIKPLINALTAAGRMRSLYNAQSKTNNAKIQDFLAGLSNSEMPERQHQINLAYYDKQINSFKQYLADYKTWQKDKTAVGAYDRMQAFTKSTGLSMYSDVQEQMEVIKKQKTDYANAAKDFLNTKVNIDTTEAIQSLDGLNKKLKELQAQRKKAIASGDTDLSKSLAKQINQVKADIKGINPTALSTTHKVTVVPIEGSIDAQTKKVQDLQKAWRAAADDTSREEIKKQIDEAQFALDKMLGKVKDRPKMEAVEMKLPEGGIGSLVQDIRTRQENGLAVLKQKIKLEIDQEALKADTYTLQTILKDAMQNGIEGLDFQLMGLGDEIAKGFNITDEKWNEIIEQYNAKLKEKGLGPLNIDLATGKTDTNKGVKASDDLSKMNQDVSKMSSSINGIFSGIQQMGFDIPEGMSEMLGALQGMTTIMTTITAILSVIEATTSVTAATSAVKSIPVIGWALAHGGIVHAAGGYQIPGNHMSGDMVPAMVNSGELVLNKAQQGNLASQLQDNERGGGYTPSHVSGEQIWIALNNYTRRTGQGELVTWK